MGASSGIGSAGPIPQPAPGSAPPVPAANQPGFPPPAQVNSQLTEQPEPTRLQFAAQWGLIAAQYIGFALVSPVIAAGYAAVFPVCVLGLAGFEESKAIISELIAARKGKPFTMHHPDWHLLNAFILTTAPLLAASSSETGQ
jgi:hypothetical protein